ncbi:hypothetical protein [Paenibacillus rigui]|uniref:Uncharacterized protein n=1 Tax=Paenibacillus rigui TaxID=554312 RepID=A0A229UJV0_9BACL|nr:hypothetical protein [Paenibacillus rigui]OXM83585.1 hypothetical protein CF651_25105 [Paenibacillus rigui]
MLTVYFLISLFVCIVCLASLGLLRKRMQPLLLLHGYFAGTALMQQSFTVISLNLHYVRPALTWQSFWSVKLPGLFCMPVLLLWALLLLLSDKYHPGGKIALVAAVLLLMTSVDVGINKAGFIEALHWNVLYSLIRYVMILLVLWGYLTLLRSRMRKEGVAGL